MKDVTPVTQLVGQPATEVVLGPAHAGQAEQIATVWHAGWADGHLGHVPERLVEHRTLDEFRTRTPERIADTTVAVDPAGRVAGFVVVRGDELEQVYVDADWRGTDVATRLLAHGEQRVACSHEIAWLAVVAGNLRARRFYGRCGWVDTGEFENAAQAGAGTIAVPARRYEKRVRTS